MRRVLMQRTLPIHEPPAPGQRTLAFLELPPPVQRSQQLDAEARAEALSTLARLITQVVKAAEQTEMWMNDLSKIGASHLCRAACIYLRQSTPAQVEHNREST